MSASNMYNELKQFVVEVISNDKTPIGKTFKFLESKTGVQRIYLLWGFIAFLALYLVVGYGVQFLSNVVGFIYPAYASMAAIETPDSRDDTKWLTYWVVFSLFACLEYPFAFILQYIPFYFLLKTTLCRCFAILRIIGIIFTLAPASVIIYLECVKICIFFTWLFLPVMNGASVLYSSLIRPFFVDVSKEVDAGIKKAAAAGAANLLKKE